MATYKVAQDVEAEDKLLGPFSFRQFIYLIIATMAIALAWGLSQLFLPLFIIPLPIILFFGALALPLRKDQPMEVYLGALLSFYLKPRKRLWVPDGVESLVEITAPKTVDIQRTKDLSESEAQRRLSYLADIADTGGWAIRHAATPMTTSSMASDVFFEAQQTEDLFDESGNVARSFDTMITEADNRRREDAMERMHPAAAVPPAQPQPTPVTPQQQYVIPTQVQAQPEPATPTDLHFNPYPDSIHQRVITPLSQQPTPVAATPEPAISTPPPQITEPAHVEPIQTPESTSAKEVSPDIISLASNTDLSIETIQREAHRREQKHSESDDKEVFISLH